MAVGLCERVRGERERCGYQLRETSAGQHRSMVANGCRVDALVWQNAIVYPTFGLRQSFRISKHLRR